MSGYRTKEPVAQPLLLTSPATILGDHGQQGHSRAHLLPGTTSAHKEKTKPPKTPPGWLTWEVISKIAEGQEILPLTRATLFLSCFVQGDGGARCQSPFAPKSQQVSTPNSQPPRFEAFPRSLFALVACALAEASQ